MIKVVCTSCQKPLSLDETKLPMKEVTFPCPACKTKLTVDRRKFEPAASSAPAAMEVGDHPAHDGDSFGPKALIVGSDNPALHDAARLIGFTPLYVPTAQQARDYYLQEFPPMVMLNPAQLTPPPLESMQPIISLTPIDRRKSFFVLFSENLRTLDGNAAFLYGVNLVVALKDLGAFPQIHREAFSFHERLYGAMNSVMKVIAAS